MKGLLGHGWAMDGPRGGCGCCGGRPPGVDVGAPTEEIARMRRMMEVPRAIADACEPNEDSK